MRSPANTCLASSSAEDNHVGIRGLALLSGRSLLTRRLLHPHFYQCSAIPSRRLKRRMTPEVKKDALYWDKRRKNNEAARRSREKRRFNDVMLEGQLLALSEENARLRAEVLSLQDHMKPQSSTEVTHLLHPKIPLPCHTQSNVQPILCGIGNGIPSADLCQPWGQHNSCSASPITSFLEVLPLPMNFPMNSIVPLCTMSLDMPTELSNQGSRLPKVIPTVPQNSSSSDQSREQRSSMVFFSTPSSHSPQPPQNWPLTGITRSSNQYNNMLLHWGSSHLHQPPLHSHWPQPFYLPP